LEKALEVKKRRLFNGLHDVNVVIPEKKLDITSAMRSLYAKLLGIFSQGMKKLTFSSLVPSKIKEDKVYTFIPLLHLANESKVELGQKEHFGEIDISQPEVKAK
jgi:chromatin segregation and condensation protein Rec8/ScpA/Scc1 (kleisin family)